MVGVGADEVDGGVDDEERMGGTGAGEEAGDNEGDDRGLGVEQGLVGERERMWERWAMHEVVRCWQAT